MSASQSASKSDSAPNNAWNALVKKYNNIGGTKAHLDDDDDDDDSSELSDSND
jgi:hypothetical protein